MATMTLTNVFGNNTTQIATSSHTLSSDHSEIYYSGTTVSVTAGHRYYVRAYTTGPEAGSGRSAETKWGFATTDKSWHALFGGANSSPSSGVNHPTSTDHNIFIVPSGVSTLQLILMWGVSANQSGAHTATFYLLIDITALENAVGFQYSANTFWDKALGSTLFTKTKSVTYTPASNSWNLMDSDGTTVYQISKVWDNNGTSSYEIGKIYDNDGSSSRLIYSAEESILSQFSTSDYYTPSGAYQAASKNSDGSLQFNATSYICRNIWTPKIDLSSYTKLTIKYSVSASSQEAGNNPNRRMYIMANSTNNFNADWNNRSDMYQSSVVSPGTTYYTMYQSGYAGYYGQSYYVEPNLDTGLSYTKNIDITNWTGSLKLGIGVMCSANNTLTLKVTDVILS